MLQYLDWIHPALAFHSPPLSPPADLRSSELILTVQRTAALKLDWAKVTTSLGLRGQTVTSLQAFKKRNDDVRRKVQALSELPTTVDFAHYRSVLKNTAIVDEIEKRFSTFKASTYDVSRQLKAIEAFEVEAIRNAEATKEKVDLELQDLHKTLKNIEEARPFEDLTVVCPPPSSLRGAGFETMLTRSDRTKWLRRSRRSTRRPRSLSPRAAGPFLDTRRVPNNPPLYMNELALILEQEKFGDLSIL